MVKNQRWQLALSGLGMAIVLALAGCGGGGGNEGGVSGVAVTPAVPPVTPIQDPNAPTATGNTATDGFNWINYRRTQAGLAALARNSRIDTAAQGHSDYQRLNNLVTHDQVVGQPGFTGVKLVDRLGAAGYALSGSWAAGEIISATSNSSGFYHAEQLIAAIYHRFVMFEPIFREIGTGSAAVNGGYIYFTADLATVNGFGPGLGAGNIVTYPVNNQTQVPTNFFSDTESPDPVPNQNEVGYPVSVHADSGRAGELTVQSFSIAPRGGAALTTRLLSHANDTPHTGAMAAAIVPLAPLRSGTTYDVSFQGAVGGASVSRSWSFTTR